MEGELVEYESWDDSTTPEDWACVAATSDGDGLGVGYRAQKASYHVDRVGV